MNILQDKLIFFLICMSLYLRQDQDSLLIVPVVITVIASSLSSLIDHPIFRITASLAFIIAGLFLPGLLYFLPLICFDIFASGQLWPVLICAVPVYYHRQIIDIAIPFQLLLLILLAWVFYRRALTVGRWREQAIRLQDETTEEKMKLLEQQKSLLEKQDYELNLARLSERNRIAREIHDNLGHQLSRAILQLGALLTICSEQPAKEAIISVKQTLAESMENIRVSVHDLHDSSISLEAEIRKIADSFTACELDLDYDITDEPTADCKFALIAIVREGLANVIRHSNATRTELTLRQHPAFYQLVISDNGSCADSTVLQADRLSSAGGLGLNSMRERVRALQGIIHITCEHGFRIFVTLPRDNPVKF